MAQATAICTCKYCGREFIRIKDCYNRKDADEWEAWAVDHINTCNECSKKRRAEKYAQENVVAAQESNSLGLPELTGSEKQIAWATTIRMKFIHQINLRKETIEKKLNEPEAVDRAKRMLQSMESDVAVLLSRTEAAWWIENRDYKLKDIVRISKM